MTFGNGSGKLKITGKSIADHMRDAIAQGMTESEGVAYVLSKCVSRLSKKRIRALYEDLRTEPK